MKNRVKYFVIYALIFVVFGLLPDICYYNLRDQCDCVAAMSRNLAGLFHPVGITYDSALKKITNLAGVIITVMGLILSTYMNLMQRLEKNIYGITYKEMQDYEDSFFRYTLACIRIISYFAPIILIFVLNFGLCFTGYILYVFCWLSAVLELHQYVECFREERIPRKVAGVILGLLPDIEEWREDDIQTLDIRVDAMSAGLRKEGAWSKVDPVFEAFTQKMERYDPQNRQFFQNIFADIFVMDMGVTRCQPVTCGTCICRTLIGKNISIRRKVVIMHIFGECYAASCHQCSQMIFASLLMIYST